MPKESFTDKVARYRKGAAAAAGAASLAISQGLIHGQAAKWTAFAIGVLTAAGVIAVPNEPAG